MNFKELLRTAYKDEVIITQNFIEKEKNIFEATFVFPPYERTHKKVGEKMNHVSAVQMEAALLEALYCVIEFSVMKHRIPVSLEWFLTNGPFLLIGHQKIAFRSKVRIGEVVAIRMKITKVLSTKRYFIAFFKFEGFIEGRINCFFPKN